MASGRRGLCGPRRRSALSLSIQGIRVLRLRLGVTVRRAAGRGGTFGGSEYSGAAEGSPLLYVRA